MTTSEMIIFPSFLIQNRALLHLWQTVFSLIKKQICGYCPLHKGIIVEPKINNLISFTFCFSYEYNLQIIIITKSSIFFSSSKCCSIDSSKAWFSIGSWKGSSLELNINHANCEQQVLNLVYCFFHILYFPIQLFYFF